MGPYSAAREGAAFAALPGRGLLAVSGPLRQKFLHDLLSNDVRSLAPGESCRAALLDVKGRVLALLRAVVDRDEIVLEVQADRAEAVEALLVHYRVAAPVRFRAQPADIVGVFGPRAAAVLGISELRPESHARATIGGAAVRAVRAGDLPADGVVVYAEAGAGDAVAHALAGAGAEPLPGDVLDVLRIEDGRPWYGVDVTDANLLHETGLIREYHSPTKGCYVGQEVVARLEARGANVNKLLRGLRLSAPAAAGDRIAAGGRDAGEVTTAGVSPALGAIAMGYVHRAAFEPGTAVEVAGVRATVARLPLRDTAEG